MPITFSPRTRTLKGILWARIILFFLGDESTY